MNTKRRGRDFIRFRAHYASTPRLWRETAVSL